MAQKTLDIANERLDLWLEAEAKVAGGQSYTIGDRTMTRADLSEIRSQIRFWEGRVEQLERRQSNRSKTRQIVPNMDK